MIWAVRLITGSRRRRRFTVSIVVRDGAARGSIRDTGAGDTAVREIAVLRGKARRVIRSGRLLRPCLKIYAVYRGGMGYLQIAAVDPLAGVLVGVADLLVMSSRGGGLRRALRLLLGEAGAWHLVAMLLQILRRNRF